jgi:hypothetical protein
LLPRELEDLIAGLFDLAGHMRVDAVAAALFDVEIVLLGEFVSLHEGEKIRIPTGFELFSRFANVLILTP